MAKIKTRQTPLLSEIEKSIPASGNQIEISRVFTKFLKEFITLRNGQYSFEGREWLHDICQDESKIIVIRKGRQVGMTTYIIAKIVHNALLYPYTNHIYVTSSIDKVRIFSQDKLNHILDKTPLPTDTKDKIISRYYFPNGSTLYILSGYSEFKQARSIDADFCYLDECQDTDLDGLPNLIEAMAQSKHGKLIVTGTGAYEGSAWHRYYQSTTQAEWNGKQWVNQNPTGINHGYAINQLMMPNITKEEIEHKRKTYLQSKFDFEVLGRFSVGAKIPLPYSLVKESYKDDIRLLQPAEIEKSEESKLYACIDWASGGDAFTVVTLAQVIGTEEQIKQQDYKIKIVSIHRYNDSNVQELGDKVKTIIDYYKPDYTYADIGGNTGALQILESANKVIKVSLGENPANIINYSKIEEQDQVSVDKSNFVQKVISWFEDWQNSKITIPLNADTEWSIEHLTAEESHIVTKSGGNTVLRFSLMPNRNDDFLMSLVFLAVAIKVQTDEDNPANHEFWFTDPNDPSV